MNSDFWTRFLDGLEARAAQHDALADNTKRLADHDREYAAMIRKALARGVCPCCGQPLPRRRVDPSQTG